VDRLNSESAFMTFSLYYRLIIIMSVFFFKSEYYGFFYKNVDNVEIETWHVKLHFKFMPWVFSTNN
jgi:hypothetical protein